MTEDKYLKIQTPRDALTVLSLRFYEKFGKPALPLIEDVSYQLGRAIRPKMREGLTDHSLSNVGQAFVDADRKRGTNIQIIAKSNGCRSFASCCQAPAWERGETELMRLLLQGHLDLSQRVTLDVVLKDAHPKSSGRAGIMYSD